MAEWVHSCARRFARGFVCANGLVWTVSLLSVGYLKYDPQAARHSLLLRLPLLALPQAAREQRIRAEAVVEAKEEPAGTEAPLIFVNADVHLPSLRSAGAGGDDGGPVEGVMEACGVPCTLRTGSDDDPGLNSELMSSADAVVWDPRWPGPVAADGATKRPGQKWVLDFYYEAPVYMGTKVAYDETLALDAKIDWTMSYQTRSDFVQPAWSAFAVEPASKAELAAAPEPPDYSRGRDKILLWFVSNCDPERTRLGTALQEALPPGSFEIYGSCGEPSPCPGRNESDECHQELFARFKFYAAFENARCDGYITEKFWRAALNGMVPLVLGGLARDDYESHGGLPPDALVSTDDFSSLGELAGFLSGIDDASYNKLHRWRTTYRVVNHTLYEDAWCRLCEELQKPPEEQRASGASLRGASLDEWLYGGCRDPLPSWV